jgi:asparagine synthase (glutamine-hydrolysing)
MCGIAGFISKKPLDQGRGLELTRRMLDRILHRGPDERGLLQKPEVGFFGGMQRLSIIDLSTGQQPIWNEHHTIAVLFNGEIYNYVELRKDLISRGHTFQTGSDTEVLVHLYEEMGPHMPTHLRGMFAFAILDLRNNRCLIARDHFGQKPLYYWAKNDQFAFASEIKSLLALPFVPCEADPEAFLDYVSWLRLPAPQTHFQGIYRLGPGQLLDIDLANPAAASAKTWWTFQFSESPQYNTMPEASAALEAALDESVRLHLRSDVPVGIMLSGGLDSRVIAEFAKTRVSSPLQTFSVEFDGEGSEGPAALQSARALGSQHHAIRVTAEDLGNTISEVAWHLDEPVADPAAFAVMKLCHDARDHVKVLLGGEGADELFGGYAGRYQTLVSRNQRTSMARIFLKWLPKGNRASMNTWWQRLCYRTHRSTEAELVEGRVEGLPGPSAVQWVLSRDQLIRMADRAETIARKILPISGEVLNLCQQLDVRWQLAESLLQKSDKMSMAASLELRCPFLDPVIASVAAQVPHRFRLGRSGPGKLVLRETLKMRIGALPDLPKKGFPLPLAAWIRGPLRHQVQDSVFDSNFIHHGLIDKQLLHMCWAAFQAGSDELVEIFYSIWLYATWSKLFWSPENHK